jgi:hypothetical protein
VSCCDWPCPVRRCDMHDDGRRDASVPRAAAGCGAYASFVAEDRVGRTERLSGGHTADRTNLVGLVASNYASTKPRHATHRPCHEEQCARDRVAEIVLRDPAGDAHHLRDDASEGSTAVGVGRWGAGARRTKLAAVACLKAGGPECGAAEGAGFEPAVRVNGLRFSRPVHSTSLPPLRTRPA